MRNAAGSILSGVPLLECTNFSDVHHAEEIFNTPDIRLRRIRIFRWIDKLENSDRYKFAKRISSVPCVATQVSIRQKDTSVPKCGRVYGCHKRDI